MADLRPQYKEEVCAHGHPTKADVTNRAWNIEHDPDGTHKQNIIHSGNIVDDAIDSEHYVDESIDKAHLSADCVDDTKIGDAKVKKEHINTDIRGTGLAGGAGTALSVDGIVEANSDELKVKVIEIGAWNMDTTGFVDIAHGLTKGKIRTISAVIRSDDDNETYPVSHGGTDGIGAGSEFVSTINVRLTRVLAGPFDNNSFDIMGDDGNRGWITIWYVV